MKAQEISAGVYCIHADICARTSRFEGLWMLPQGVSINSYIVKGEKTALIDIVRDWDGSLKSYTEQLESIGLSFKDIDYLILNHLEPDHCDLIEYVHSCNPQAEVISTSKGLAMLLVVRLFDTSLWLLTWQYRTTQRNWESFFNEELISSHLLLVR